MGSSACVFRRARVRTTPHHAYRHGELKKLNADEYKEVYKSALDLIKEEYPQEVTQVDHLSIRNSFGWCKPADDPKGTFTITGKMLLCVHNSISEQSRNPH